jgi:hypothetical protein
MNYSIGKSGLNQSNNLQIDTHTLSSHNNASKTLRKPYNISIKGCQENFSLEIPFFYASPSGNQGVRATLDSLLLH